MRVAIVGGGVSGLSAAYRLRAAGHQITLLEEESRLGGKVYSDRADGYLVEHGPNGFLDSRESMIRLARDLGLEDRLLRADDAAKRRYLYLDGKLRTVPSSPPALLKSNLLSLGGRLRLLGETIVGRGRLDDESIYDFAVRRVGKEVAEKLVDPMVTGIFAGDIRRLSLRAAFPVVHELEQKHGSVIRGFKASRGGGGPGRLTSFPNGMSELVSALENAVGDGIQTGRVVTSIHGAEASGWRLSASGGDEVTADAVVLATPTAVSARLLSDLAPGAVAPLESVHYAPVAVVAVGYRRADVRHPLDGFGLLSPSTEGLDVLGVLWASSIFSDRAPDDTVLLRAIVGGAHRPELVGLDDDALMATVTAEFKAVLDEPLGDPVFTRIIRWPAGIPQYEMGHCARVEEVRGALSQHRGLHLAGNGLFGVSLAECVTRAEDLVSEVGA